ncbi:MAG: NYN domain-containing protein [Verrucomicrobia bacterium]|nr:MAG: NYN domain-containing protein [Verrucomicrobiota bacterium]
MADANPFPKLRAIAVLIDGDNAQPSLLDEILAEISRYGRTTIRRIYGDWTSPNMNGWKDVLQENAIQPIQQFRHTVGKNATDSAMIIEAMDILYSGVADGFCVVSSDSDYTRLTTRIREKGLFVMGIGRQATAKSFRNACDVFVFTENLTPQEENSAPQEEKPKQKSAPATSPTKVLSVMKALPLLRKALENCAQDDGWATLSSVGSTMRSLDSSFDHRTYGCSNLRTMIGRFPDFLEIREERTNGGNTVAYVRRK